MGCVVLQDEMLGWDIMLCAVWNWIKSNDRNWGRECYVDIWIEHFQLFEFLWIFLSPLSFRKIFHFFTFLFNFECFLDTTSRYELQFVYMNSYIDVNAVLRTATTILNKFKHLLPVSKFSLVAYSTETAVRMVSYMNMAMLN